MANIMRARLINQTLGGAFVEPGEVDDLPLEFVEAIYAMTSDLQHMKQGLLEEEKLFAEFRAKHPTYRKQ